MHLRDECKKFNIAKSELKEKKKKSQGKNKIHIQGINLFTLIDDANNMHPVHHRLNCASIHPRQQVATPNC
jgi:hypothetical protein